MNSVVDAFIEETFFSPAPTDLIDSLVARYQFDRKRIAEVVEFSKGEACKGVMHYFLNGNATQDRGRISMEMSASQLFSEEGAIAQLNASFWQEALNLTDVYDAMPQDRRNQWNAQIQNPRGKLKRHGSDEWETPPLPDFEEETVRATLTDLLASRHRFLAERVDGIFRNLSGEHVTNSPAAFSKRMIIAHLFSAYDTANHGRIGYINDLRCVIAKFMGRDEPKWYASDKVVQDARRYHRGEWVVLDGGSLRLRAYKCGTAHLEVHPDMAWRLNQILHFLHPLAIPPEFRQKPKKKPKDFVMMGRPLPFAVIEMLADMEQEPVTIYKDRWTPPKPGRTSNLNSRRFKNFYSKDNKQILAEAEKVLEYIGGVKMDEKTAYPWYEFDFNPDMIIREIVHTGCLPDQRAHQFYPTPESVGEVAVAMAQIGEEHSCLEPSAGRGNLADKMPKDRTICVEISKLHSSILVAKGYQVAVMDFLQYQDAHFDRIVMNPPFSEGRWQAHVEHAATLLNPRGRLVAIVPASARNKYELPGFDITWSEVLQNEFANTSIAVAVMAAERKGV